jgi:hypothetical protein
MRAYTRARAAGARSGRRSGLRRVKACTTWTDRSASPPRPGSGPPSFERLRARAGAAPAAPTTGRFVRAVAGRSARTSRSAANSHGPRRDAPASSIAFNVSMSSGSGSAAGVVHRHYRHHPMPTQRPRDRRVAMSHGSVAAARSCGRTVRCGRAPVDPLPQVTELRRRDHRLASPCAAIRSARAQAACPAGTSPGPRAKGGVRRACRGTRPAAHRAGRSSAPPEAFDKKVSRT